MLRYTNIYLKQNTKQYYVIRVGFYSQGWKVKYHQLRKNVYFTGLDTAAGRLAGEERCRVCSEQRPFWNYRVFWFCFFFFNFLRKDYNPINFLPRTSFAVSHRFWSVVFPFHWFHGILWFPLWLFTLNHWFSSSTCLSTYVCYFLIFSFCN